MASIGVLWLYQGKARDQTQKQDEGVLGLPGLTDSTLKNAASQEN